MFLSLEATPRSCQDHHPKKVHVVRKPLHAFASAVTAVVVRGKDELFLNSSLCGLSFAILCRPSAQGPGCSQPLYCCIANTLPHCVTGVKCLN